MSRPLRCLSTSLRTCVPTGSRLEPSRGTRRYVQAALKMRSDYEPRTAAQRLPKRTVVGETRTVYADEDEFDTRGVSTGDAKRGLELGRTEDGHQENERENWSARTRKPELHFAEHLDGLFPTLQFPRELARRILTHGSHPAAVNGHNAGLSFVGRRVLESYLLLLLTSSPALHPKHDVEDIVSRTLNTYVLGEHVGPIWGLGRVLRWTPTVSAQKLRPGEDQKELLKSVGLYKVQGDTVAAVMGGIYQQFGASVSHRVFHTRLLPNVLLPGKLAGLPDVFHGDAEAVCERMGGPNGKLLLQTSSHPLTNTATAN